MNLHDVVVLEKKKTITKSGAFTKINDDRQVTIKSLETINAGVVPRNVRSSVIDVSNYLIEKYNTSAKLAIKDEFIKAGNLPSDVPSLLTGQTSYYNDAYKFSEVAFKGDETRFTNTPKAATQKLRELAERTGMILIPYDYLDPSSFSSESYSLKSEIASFSKAASGLGLNAYVMCPIRHYSITKHISAKDPNKEIFAGLFQQHFDIMAMMMPAMIMMEDRISALEFNMGRVHSNIDSLDAATKNIIKGLENINARLAMMEKTVEETKRKLFEEEIKKAEMQNLIEAKARSTSWFMMNDPMLIALSGSIMDDGVSFVGPCWGPEMADVAFEMHNLTKVVGQRKRITTAISDNF